MWCGGCGVNACATLTQSLITQSLSYSPTQSITHSITHSRDHTLTQSITRLLTHPLNQSLTQSLIHAITHSINQSITQLLSHSINHSINHSVTHALTQPVTHSINQSHSHSITHSLSNSLIPSYSLRLNNYPRETELGPSSTLSSHSMHSVPITYLASPAATGLVKHNGKILIIHCCVVLLDANEIMSFCGKEEIKCLICVQMSNY